MGLPSISEEGGEGGAFTVLVAGQAVGFGEAVDGCGAVGLALWAASHEDAACR